MLQKIVHPMYVDEIGHKNDVTNGNNDKSLIFQVKVKISAILNCRFQSLIVHLHRQLCQPKIEAVWQQVCKLRS